MPADLPAFGAPHYGFSIPSRGRTGSLGLDKGLVADQAAAFCNSRNSGRPANDLPGIPMGSLFDADMTDQTVRIRIITSY